MNGAPIPKGLQLSWIFPLAAFCFLLSPAAAAGPYHLQEDTTRIAVQGVVTDTSGTPLAGVNVTVEGTVSGAATDTEGRYSISGVPPNAVLLVSYLGYESRQVPVNNRTHIDIQLREAASRLADVVVIGYGTARKASITGSVSTVSGPELSRAPVTNFTNTLAGRMPGLVTLNRSGEPGNDNPQIRIRGANTLGDNSALVVIDGIAGRDMTGLDPADIESVTILKDASAAIYGARAANGVILITTKRGLEQRTQVNVNMNYGIGMPTVVPEMADAATYATMLNEINFYNGLDPLYTEDEIQKYRDGSDPWRYPNTDWFDAVLKPSSPQSSANLSIRGGTENMKYFVSTGYRHQDALYRNSSAKYSQVNFRANIDGKVSDHIYLSFDFAGNQEDRGFASSPFTYMINRSKPNLLAYYPGNKPATGYQAGANPVVTASDALGYDKRREYNFLSNARLRATIPGVEGLSFSGNVSVDKGISYNKLWRTPYILYSWDGATLDERGEPVVNGAPDGPYATPQLDQSTNDGMQLTLNAMAEYERSVAGAHRFKLMLGTEKIRGESMGFSAFRTGFISTAIDELFAGGDPDKDNSGSSDLSRRMNYFGRLNYDFNNKYLLEIVGRYDGSYIFPSSGRYGFFPGVSAGWVLSEEGFWKNSLGFLDYFKIRASWGQTGNDRIEAFQYLSSYGFGGGTFILGESVEAKTINELRIANPNITWEVANQFNIGFDGTLNGNIQFSAEYFYNFRNNILAYRNASVPNSSGLSLPRENIGEVVNQGVEAQLGYRNRWQSFSLEVLGNLAYARNKIHFWDEVPGAPEYQRSTGKPMNAGLYYRAIGIFRDEAHVESMPHWNGARPGDIIFEDYNGDGEINGQDLVRFDKTDLPTLTGGLSLNLGYKDFYAAALFQGAAGAVRTYTLESGFQGNFLAQDAYGRWTAENPDADKPRTWNTGGEYWTTGVSGGTAGINNTYWLKNNNYLRLKTLQVGYNLPENLSKRLGLSSLSVYFSGSNLFTITPLQSFDPETVGNVYPLSKVYNIGFNISI